jgi:predicted Mrr-cat superfamily restriction endonuclease
MAHILECTGYTARVTPKSGDGGVDVIAHMDPLGFQPPIVKVQCKRTTSQTPRPDVDQLLGTLGDGEYGLFVNLGSYARGAVELERNRAKLRLINGEQFVELFFEHYASLSPRYRTMIPLKQISFQTSNKTEGHAPSDATRPHSLRIGILALVKSAGAGFYGVWAGRKKQISSNKHA